MSAVNLSLLPSTSTVVDGELLVGGVRIADLADQYGTPLFVYDEEHLRNQCRAAVQAFGSDSVIYATKAFLCVAMARLAHDEGLFLDVATGGELHVALHAGVPGNRCVMHGNNKSVDELRMAINSGVRHIVVDSFDELDRLDLLRAEGLGVPRIQLRITPGTHVDTHDYISTGQDDSKFGFNLNNGDAHRAIERARTSSSVELVGLHCHIGSNVLAIENFETASTVMVELFASSGLSELTLGGGLGVAYTNEEVAPTMGQWAEVLKRATASLPSTARIYVEPGRSIVATAGLTVYRVGTVKNIDGIRTYIAVDGGMSDNMRPALYESVYEVCDPRRITADRTSSARIVGKHCESGDVLVFDAPVPEGIAVGDLLVTPVTGAYGYSMANNYNKMARPAVVFVAQGKSRVVVRRETLDDLVRLDQ